MDKLYLFDLGGVVVRWTGFSELAKLSKLSYEETIKRFSRSTICSAFETGQTQPTIFLNHMIDLYGLNLSPDAFKRMWNGWVGDCFEGVEDSIKELGQKNKTACLSNTNDLHWQHLNQYFDTSEVFHHVFASHQIKAVKPDKTAYKVVFNRTAYEPENIIFFDDTQININAAKAVGMQAYKVDPNVGVLPILKSLNLIS